MRKSPIFHHVHSHVRSDGDRVHAYTRGEGYRRSYTRSYATRIVLPKEVSEGVWCDHDDVIKKSHCGECVGKEDYSKSHELRFYTVTLKYANGSETVRVPSHSPEESIHMAMTKVSPRHRQERPTQVTSKNNLGEVVGALGRYAKKGVVAAGKVAKWGVKETGKAIVKYAKDRRSAQLLRETQSADIVTRTRARQTLRKSYPEVYEAAGFAGPAPQRRILEVIRREPEREMERLRPEKVKMTWKEREAVAEETERRRKEREKKVGLV